MVSSKTAPQRFEAGQTAPDFTLKDVMGKSVSLNNYSDKTILLVFMRFAGCPYCNLAIHRLALEQKLLAKDNCQVIAFIESSEKNINTYIYDRHAVRPSFPIIADPERAAYDQYGVRPSYWAAARSIPDIPYWVNAVKKHGFKQGEVDGNAFMTPAMFLIDGETRKIIKVKYSQNFYDNETFTDIYQWLTFRDS